MIETRGSVNNMVTTYNEGTQGSGGDLRSRWKRGRGMIEWYC